MSRLSKRGFGLTLSLLVPATAVYGLVRRKRERFAALRLIVGTLSDSTMDIGVRRAAVDRLRSQFGWVGIMAAVHLMRSRAEQGPGASYWALMHALRAEMRTDTTAEIPAVPRTQLREFLRTAPKPSSRREGIRCVGEGSRALRRSPDGRKLAALETPFGGRAGAGYSQRNPTQETKK